MNILIALLMMIPLSFADVDSVAKKIATTYQTFTDGMRPGTYSTTIMVTYDFVVNNEVQGSIPVYLSEPQPLMVPSTIAGCETQSSISCEQANYLAKWLTVVAPTGDGQFFLQFAFYGKGISKEASITIDRSELR